MKIKFYNLGARSDPHLDVTCKSIEAGLMPKSLYFESGYTSYLEKIWDNIFTSIPTADSVLSLPCKRSCNIIMNTHPCNIQIFLKL